MATSSTAASNLVKVVAAPTGPASNSDEDAKRHLEDLYTLEYEYLTNYILVNANAMLGDLASTALATLVPEQQLAFLRLLLPLLEQTLTDNGVKANSKEALEKLADQQLKAIKALMPGFDVTTAQLTAEKLAESPKIKKLPQWKMVYNKEIEADPDFMQKKAAQYNQEALNDLKFALQELLAGSQDTPGLIPSIEDAIKKASDRFASLQQTLLAEAVPAKRLQAIDGALQAAAPQGVIEQEQAHYIILLTAYRAKVNASIESANKRFTAVQQQSFQDANRTVRLQAVQAAITGIGALNIADPDEAAHYTGLLTSFRDTLSASIEVAIKRFTAVQQTSFTDPNRRVRLQAVQAAIAGIAGLNIVDPDEAAHYSALLANFAGALQVAVEAAEKEFTSRFAGLEERQRLDAIIAELKTFPPFGTGDDAKEHLRILLQAEQNRLEAAFGLAITKFANTLGKIKSPFARLLAVQQKLAEHGTGSASMLTQSAMAAQKQPALLAVVAAATSVVNKSASQAAAPGPDNKPS